MIWGRCEPSNQQSPHVKGEETLGMTIPGGCAVTIMGSATLPVLDTFLHQALSSEGRSLGPQQGGTRAVFPFSLPLRIHHRLFAKSTWQDRKQTPNSSGRRSRNPAQE